MLCDFIGTHGYPQENDLVRQHYRAARVCGKRRARVRKRRARVRASGAWRSTHLDAVHSTDLTDHWAPTGGACAEPAASRRRTSRRAGSAPDPLAALVAKPAPL